MHSIEAREACYRVWCFLVVSLIKESDVKNVVYIQI